MNDIVVSTLLIIIIVVISQQTIVIRSILHGFYKLLQFSNTNISSLLYMYNVLHIHSTIYCTKVSKFDDSNLLKVTHKL